MAEPVDLAKLEALRRDTRIGHFNAFFDAWSLAYPDITAELVSARATIRRVEAALDKAMTVTGKPAAYIAIPSRLGCSAPVTRRATMSDSGATTDTTTIPHTPDLGDRVRDQVTGYEGVITARTEYLDDSIASLRVTRADRNGLPEDTWLPRTRLDCVGEKSSAGFRP